MDTKDNENKTLQNNSTFSPFNSTILKLLILVVLVAAVPLTVFLAQEQQELRQRAMSQEGGGTGPGGEDPGTGSTDRSDGSTTGSGDPSGGGDGVTDPTDPNSDPDPGSDPGTNLDPGNLGLETNNPDSSPNDASGDDGGGSGGDKKCKTKPYAAGCECKANNECSTNLCFKKPNRNKGVCAATNCTVEKGKAANCSCTKDSQCASKECKPPTKNASKVCKGGPIPSPIVTTPITPGVDLSADIDVNGCIDIRDFNEWVYTMQHNGTPRQTSFRPDVNGDSQVNILDFNGWFNAMRSGQNLCNN